MDTTGRVIGVDVARALAIIGMVMVHVGPTAQPGLAGTIYALPHGRASLLFVLVAGVGVSLLAAARSSDRTAFRLTLSWRAALLLPLGLALQLLDHGANVILQIYAALFVIALFVIALVAARLPDRGLVGLVALMTVTGPGIFLWGETRSPEVFDRGPIAWGDPPTEILHELVLSGPYPLVVWIVPFLLGMWLGRRDLRSRPLAWRLVLVGSAVAVGAQAVSAVLLATLGTPGEAAWFAQAATTAAHRQTPLWLIEGTALACATFGAMLLMTADQPPWAGPFVAAGQLALTIYVAHLVVLHLFPDTATADRVGPATFRVALATLAMLAFSWAWRARWPRGPLEVMLRPPIRR